jgi:hypothetical protein
MHGGGANCDRSGPHIGASRAENNCTLIAHHKVTREVAMNWSTGFSWLAALKPSLASASGDADPADMGTAFGLDASFDALGPDDAAVAPAATSPLPWEHRLTRRTGL